MAPLQHVETRIPRRLTPLSYRAVRWVILSADASPGRVAFIHELLAECPAPVRAGFGRLLAGLDLTASIPHLAAPVLVIAGEKDRLLPPWHSEQLAERLPNVSDLVVLPGVGHVAPIEKPGAVTSRLAELAQPLSPSYPGSVSPPIGARTSPE